MNPDLYVKLLRELKLSANSFLGDGTELSDEVEEDISSIIDSVDISSWECNVDGVIKNFSQLLYELNEANSKLDRAACIQAIAMLRIAISDIENAFSNSMDSMESLLVSIRDSETESKGSK